MYEQIGLLKKCLYAKLSAPKTSNGIYVTESFSYNDSSAKTKYGLILNPTGALQNFKLSALHVLDSVSLSNTDLSRYNPSEKIVKYNSDQKRYIIDECLHRIYNQHGERFENVVKLMLDYN